MVTSDCRPLGRSADIFYCPSCSFVQRLRSQEWRAECARIYETYFAYPQPGNLEVKTAFTNKTGGQSRSLLVLERLNREGVVNQSGTWLDYGCGDGHLLMGCQQVFPNMELFGTDVSRNTEKSFESLEGITFIPNRDISVRKYDVISLFHVLEHAEDPIALLSTLRECLKPGGMLLIQVPNHLANHYDLLIYDHGTFFSKETLNCVLTEAKLGFLLLSEHWIRKEITVICRRLNDHQIIQSKSPSVFGSQSLRTMVNELVQMKQQALKIVNQGKKIDIFGTSIGATWLAFEVGIENVRSFLDEDRSRAESMYHGRIVQEPSPDSARKAFFPIDRVTKNEILSRVSKN